MSCCGKHAFKAKSSAKSEKPKDYFIGPYEPCVFCAEKHLSDALDLARECGYETPNRQAIIGALGSCARHLWTENRATAEKVRAARHLIQRRREAEVDWMPMLAEMDALATAANENVKPEESPK